MNKCVSAITVSNYIISKHNVNNLHLQKLLYYIQINYMVRNNGELLFQDSIQKWKLGPVIPKVYHAFKKFGSSDIDETYQEYTVEMNDEGEMVINKLKESLSNEQKTLIDIFLKDLLRFDKFDLVDRTHQHPQWEEYQAKIMAGERNLEYDYNLLYEYFKKEREQLLVSIDEQ